jgi:hypothetical protein
MTTRGFEPSSDLNAPRKVVNYESMDRPAWAQTLKDVPLSIVAMGIGYGVGATAVEMYAKKNMPATLKYGPVALSAAAAAAPLLQNKLRTILKERREAARQHDVKAK